MSHLTGHVIKTGVMSHAARNKDLYFRVQEKMGNGLLCIRLLHRMYVNKKIIKSNSYPTCLTGLKILWKFFLMKLVSSLESWVISQHSFLLLLITIHKIKVKIHCIFSVYKETNFEQVLTTTQIFHLGKGECFNLSSCRLRKWKLSPDLSV